MMMNFNSFGSLAWGFHFHMFFCTLLLIAVILFVTWMIRFAKKDELKKWIIGLIVVGLLGWLLTIGLGANSMGHYSKGTFGPFSGPGMMMGGMFGCMQDEECHEEMEEFMHGMMETEE